MAVKWNVPNTEEIETALRKVRDCETQISDLRVNAIYALSEFVALISAELHESLSDGRKLRGSKAYELHEKYLNISIELNSISKDLGYGVSFASDFKKPSLGEEDDEE